MNHEREKEENEERERGERERILQHYLGNTVIENLIK